MTPFMKNQGLVIGSIGCHILDQLNDGVELTQLQIVKAAKQNSGGFMLKELVDEIKWLIEEGVIIKSGKTHLEKGISGEPFTVYYWKSIIST